MRAARWSPKKSVRPASLLACRASPHVVERLNHVARRGPFDLHRGVAPTRAMLFLNAGRPFASDTNATGDASSAVDDKQLAMVARNHPQPGTKPRRIEYGDAHALFSKAANEVA